MAVVISIHDVRKIHAWADSSPMKLVSEIDLGQVQFSLFEHEIKSISQHELNGTDDLRRLCRLYILILWDHFVPLVKLENISESELFTGDTSKDNRSLGSGKENGAMVDGKRLRMTQISATFHVKIAVYNRFAQVAVISP